MQEHKTPQNQWSEDITFFSECNRLQKTLLGLQKLLFALSCTSPLSELAVISRSERGIDNDIQLLWENSIFNNPASSPIANNSQVTTYRLTKLCFNHMNIIDTGISEAKYLLSVAPNFVFVRFYLAKLYSTKANFIKQELDNPILEKYFSETAQIENKLATLTDCALQAYELLIPLLREYGKTRSLMFELGSIISLGNVYKHFCTQFFPQQNPDALLEVLTENLKQTKEEYSEDYTDPYKQIGSCTPTTEHDVAECKSRHLIAQNLDIYFTSICLKELKEFQINLQLQISELEAKFALVPTVEAGHLTKNCTDESKDEELQIASETLSSQPGDLKLETIHPIGVVSQPSNCTELLVQFTFLKNSARRAQEEEAFPNELSLTRQTS